MLFGSLRSNTRYLGLNARLRRLQVNSNLLHTSSKVYSEISSRLSEEDKLNPIVAYDAFATSRASNDVLLDDREGPKIMGELVDEHTEITHTVLTMEENIGGYESQYRNPETGELIQGTTSTEARFHPTTFAGLVNHRQVKIPKELAKVIENNMLLLHDPKVLKKHAADYYLELEKRGIHKRPTTEEETDAHIASTFIRNYAACYQVIDELKRRMGPNFNPQRVLDYGDGPATGMLALNEIMGDEYDPVSKDVLVKGSLYMKRRAKILLSRQLNEYFDRDHETKEEDAVNEKMAETLNEEDMEESFQEVEEELVDDEFETSNGETQKRDDSAVIGRIKTKNLKIKSVLLEKFRGEHTKYDLIIAQHQLLKDTDKFPLQVDDNINELIARLAPGGHLVLVERGNPLGSEIISRARQVLFRPENNANKLSKVPRLFKRFMVPGEQFSKDQVKKELEGIEPELLEHFHFFEDKSNEEVINLSILAPCSHHGKCPLQYGKPEYFGYGGIGKKLVHCSFGVEVERPNFTLELKRGARLAAKWESETSGSAAKHVSTPGRGRVDGKNFEHANFSYLIVERAQNDPSTLETIERLRQKEQEEVDSGSLRGIGFQSEVFNESPRILYPEKRKGFVVANACAPSGHLEKIFISKSVGKQEFHDARKIHSGDLWTLGFKSAVQSTKESEFYIMKLQEKERNIKKARSAKAKKLKKQQKKDIQAVLESKPTDFDSQMKRNGQIAHYQLMNSPKVKKFLKDKQRREGGIVEEEEDDDEDDEDEHKGKEQKRLGRKAVKQTKGK